jgi:hypothetical protein
MMGALDGLPVLGQTGAIELARFLIEKVEVENGYRVFYVRPILK